MQEKHLPDATALIRKSLQSLQNSGRTFVHKVSAMAKDPILLEAGHVLQDPLSAQYFTEIRHKEETDVAEQ